MIDSDLIKIIKDLERRVAALEAMIEIPVSTTATTTTIQQENNNYGD